MRMRLVAASVVCGLAGAASLCTATTLTFQGGAGNLGGAPFPGGIPGVYGNRVAEATGVQQYVLIGDGFTPHITSAWRLVNPTTGATVTCVPTCGEFDHARLEGGTFGSLYVGQIGVLGNLGELTLTPDPGWTLLLNTFVLASQHSPFPNQLARVLNANGAVVWEAFPLTVGPAQSQFAPMLRSTGALRLQFGTGAIGVSMIDFNEQPTPVPEAASTGPLLLLGLCALLALAAKPRCSDF